MGEFLPAQVHEDGGVDGQRGDGHPEGVRQQGLHLGGVQEGEGQLSVALQESGESRDQTVRDWKNSLVIYLKGQCHEIFDFWFFS